MSPHSASASKLRLFKNSVILKLCHSCFSLRRMFRSCIVKASGDDQIKPSTSYMYACCRYIRIRCRLWLINQNIFIFSFDEFLFDRLQFWLTSNISFASISSWWTHPHADKQRIIFFIANVYLYFVCIYSVYLYFVGYSIFNKLSY